jgi:glycosyltransferase involved in cell wall biosynthesis
MRIAMMSEHASPLAVVGGVDAGGQNVHVAALATALAQRGHEVVVYTRRDDATLGEREPLCPGVWVEHLDAGPPQQIPKDELVPFLPAMSAQLIERLPRFDPAVIHAHFWMSGVATMPVAQELQIPFVQTFHALGLVKRRHQGVADTSPSHRIDDEADIATHADRLTASCTDELRELVSMGAPRRRIDVVPSGVDLSRFNRHGPKAPRCRVPRILTIGRLVPRKGVDDMIRALPSIADAELVIAGGPDGGELARDGEAMRLRELALELGVAGRVLLLGRVPHSELPALIRSADVVSCLPWYEPFGIVPLEAMACGVPVVGTAVGGLLDTVVDGVTGLLVPPRRPEAVAAAINGLLRDPERRAAFATAGIERAAGYAWSRIAAATERTYLRAMDSGQDRGRSTQRTGVVG